MTDYEKMYFTLLGEVSEVIERLIAVMRDAEDAYCMAGTPDMTLRPRGDTD